MYRVSDFVIDRLIEWDLRRFYCGPGDGIGGLDRALGRAEEEGKEFRHLRSNHEEMAALMATAHAKFTGEVGVCIATSAPGAAHLLNGLHDARGDNQPVLAVVGQQARVAIGGDLQKELNPECLFGDVAAYVKTVSTPLQTRMVLDRAVRIARAERAPTVVILPAGIQDLAMEEAAVGRFVSRIGVGHASIRIAPPVDELARAAAVLNTGEKVAMLIGQGAMDATDEVLAVAERLGAGIITALLGKGVVPGDVPHHTQQLGPLGSGPSRDMMQSCDTLLMVGSDFPYGEFLPPEGQARGVQIDLVPRRLGLRYPMEVNLWGDSRTTLAALLPHLRQTDHLDWQNGIAGSMRAWNEMVERAAMIEADPINPRLVFHHLNAQLPSNAVVTADAGSTADCYGHHIRLGPDQMGNLSGSLATMVGAMPYALAAKFAHPDRPVVCTFGDGAFQMLGMNELVTVESHWREWADPRFIVLLLDNGDLNRLSGEMREAGGSRWDTGQLVEVLDHTAYAESLGLLGIRVEDPTRVEEALQRAFAADRPVLLQVMVDKNVPPLASHGTCDQTRSVAASIQPGDPEAREMVVNTARAVASRLFTRPGDARPGGRDRPPRSG